MIKISTEKKSCEAFIEQNYILLDIVYHNLKNLENRLLEEHGITQKQSRTLIFLYHNSDKVINQKFLEENFRLSRSTITSMMNNLEKMGFIERTSDGTDARSKIVTLTQKGKDTIDAIANCHKTIDNFIRAIIDDVDYIKLNQILKQMLKEIDSEKQRRQYD